MKQKRDILAYRCESCNALFYDKLLAIFHHKMIVDLTLKTIARKLDKHYHTIKPIKNIKKEDDNLPKCFMYNYNGVKDKIYCIICDCYIDPFKSRHSFREKLMLHDLIFHNWIPITLRGVINEHED